MQCTVFLLSQRKNGIQKNALTSYSSIHYHGNIVQFYEITRAKRKVTETIPREVSLQINCVVARWYPEDLGSTVFPTNSIRRVLQKRNKTSEKLGGVIPLK